MGVWMLLEIYQMEYIRQDLNIIFKVSMQFHEPVMVTLKMGEI